MVDIINLTSTLLVCGRIEASLALAAYGGELEARARPFVCLFVHAFIRDCLIIWSARQNQRV